VSVVVKPLFKRFLFDAYLSFMIMCNTRVHKYNEHFTAQTVKIR